MMRNLLWPRPFILIRHFGKNLSLAARISFAASLSLLFPFHLLTRRLHSLHRLRMARPLDASLLGWPRPWGAFPISIYQPFSPRFFDEVAGNRIVVLLLQSAIQMGFA
jgi:hypothetical protein